LLAVRKPAEWTAQVLAVLRATERDGYPVRWSFRPVGRINAAQSAGDRIFPFTEAAALAYGDIA